MKLLALVNMTLKCWTELLDGKNATKLITSNKATKTFDGLSSFKIALTFFFIYLQVEIEF